MLNNILFLRLDILSSQTGHLVHSDWTSCPLGLDILSSPDWTSCPVMEYVKSESGANWVFNNVLSECGASKTVHWISLADKASQVVHHVRPKGKGGELTERIRLASGDEDVFNSNWSEGRVCRASDYVRVYRRACGIVSGVRVGLKDRSSAMIDFDGSGRRNGNSLNWVRTEQKANKDANCVKLEKI